MEDLKEGPLDIATVPALYSPFNQSTDNYFALAGPERAGVRSLLPALAATIRQIDPGIVTHRGVTMRDRITTPAPICSGPRHGWWEVLPRWHCCWAWSDCMGLSPIR